MTCAAQARCSDGNTISCSGGGTCLGVDARCPSERGYVTCDGNTTPCPTPCTCSATVQCLDGEVIACGGTAPNCSSAPPSCSYGAGEPGYVECDGQRTSCGWLAYCLPTKPWMCDGYCATGPSMCNGSRCCSCGIEP